MGVCIQYIIYMLVLYSSLYIYNAYAYNELVASTRSYLFILLSRIMITSQDILACVHTNQESGIVGYSVGDVRYGTDEPSTAG